MKNSVGFFLPLYLPSFLFSFSQSLLVPVLPLYVHEFSNSYALVGLVLAGESLGMLLGDLPAGALVRRLGQKNSMSLGLALTGISTVLIFWMPSIPWVVFCRMVAGLGTSLFAVSRHYFITEMSPPELRGKIVSLFGGSFRAGRMLGPVAGGLAAAAYGLRVSFLLFGAACLVSLLIVLVFLPVIEVPTPGSQVAPLKRFAAMLHIQRHVLATAGVGFLFMQLLRSGPVTIIPLYAANILGLNVDTIGWVMGISSTLDMLMFYPAGMMMDRWGRKYAILSSSLCLGLGMACVPFASGVYSLLAAGLLAGLGNGLGSGAMLTLGADLAPRQARSEFLGAWTLIGDIGNTTGPLAVGGMAEFIPLPLTAWGIAAAGAAAALIFGFTVPETLHRRE